MKITYFSSTEEVLLEIGGRIKAARIEQSITQKELAEMTNLSQRTISNLETGKDISFSTVIDVLRTLGQLQRIELMLPEQTIRPSQIVRLNKYRKRVSTKTRNQNTTERGWKWGDEA